MNADIDQGVAGGTTVGYQDASGGLRPVFPAHRSRNGHASCGPVPALLCGVETHFLFPCHPRPVPVLELDDVPVEGLSGPEMPGELLDYRDELGAGELRLHVVDDHGGQGYFPGLSGEYVVEDDVPGAVEVLHFEDHAGVIAPEAVDGPVIGVLHRLPAGGPVELPQKVTAAAPAVQVFGHGFLAAHEARIRFPHAQALVRRLGRVELWTPAGDLAEEFQLEGLNVDGLPRLEMVREQRNVVFELGLAHRCFELVDEPGGADQLRVVAWGDMVESEIERALGIVLLEDYVCVIAPELVDGLVQGRYQGQSPGGVLVLRGELAAAGAVFGAVAGWVGADDAFHGGGLRQGMILGGYLGWDWGRNTLDRSFFLEWYKASALMIESTVRETAADK